MSASDDGTAIGGPWVSVAVLCDATSGPAHHRTYRGVFYAVRRRPGTTSPTRLQARLAVALVRGDATEEQHLEVVGHLPNGRRVALGGERFTFAGEMAHVTVTGISIPTTWAGTIWIDVRVKGQLLTRIPCLVVPEDDMVREMPGGAG